MAGGDSWTSTTSRTSRWCEMATFDGRAGCELHAGLDERVETFFFDAELIRSGGEHREGAASGEVGLAVDGGLRRRLQGDAGGGDGDSVLVGDSDGGGWRGLGRRSGQKCEREEESTHAGQGYFTVGCVGESVCWTRTNPNPSAALCRKDPLLAQKTREKWGTRICWKV